jgi:(S)-2-hydroxyglutarate dehydrogenase
VAVNTTDFLVIGGGIIGLSVAREIKKRHRGARVVVVEKENRVGAHASGRNSGVLHAGFYYSPDSLKARFTRIGNERLTEYCIERRLPIRQCGKLVIPRDETELPRLDELHRRGLASGVRVEMISAAEVREIEPRATAHERAIWSPTTSTVDPNLVMQSLLRDAFAEGIELHAGRSAVLRRPVKAKRDHQVRTASGDFVTGYIVNAAGLHADQVARQFGFSKHYRILPFKGLYLYSSEAPGAMRTHLYPVPDPRYPFLGVHFTVAVDGRLKIGPTAAPAFWREQYSLTSNFRLGEALEVASRGLALIAANPDLRRHAVEEMRKSSRRYIVSLAASLATGVRPRDYTHWGAPGIRAQLYDTQKRSLEMDFVLEGDSRSMHILNAVSPGFTCAMPFAEYVVDRIESGVAGVVAPDQA